MLCYTYIYIVLFLLWLVFLLHYITHVVSDEILCTYNSIYSKRLTQTYTDVPNTYTCMYVYIQIRFMYVCIWGIMAYLTGIRYTALCTLRIWLYVRFCKSHGSYVKSLLYIHIYGSVYNICVCDVYVLGIIRHLILNIRCSILGTTYT